MLMYIKRKNDKKYELHFDGKWEMRTIVKNKVTYKQEFVNEEEALEFFED